jgi:hypothetical protein
MKRLIIFAVAALAAAPLLADDPKPAPAPQVETITLSGVDAPQDSPLVAAAKKSKKNNAKKKVVITNATLNKDASKSKVTTTKTLTDISIPVDPAIVAEHQARPPAPKPAPPAKLTPEQQKRLDTLRARAEEEGLFDDDSGRLDAAAANAAQPQPAPPPRKP